MGTRSRRAASRRSGRPVASPNSTRPRGRRLGWGSAQRTEYNGVTYASKSEAAYAAHLDVLKKAGLVTRWEGQVKWPLVVNGVKVCGFVPDFKVYGKGGAWWLVEVKGMETAVWKLKRKLFAALHPKVDYRVVKAREALGL